MAIECQIVPAFRFDDPAAGMSVSVMGNADFDAAVQAAGATTTATSPSSTIGVSVAKLLQVKTLDSGRLRSVVVLEVTQTMALKGEELRAALSPGLVGGGGIMDVTITVTITPPMGMGMATTLPIPLKVGYVVP